MIKKAATGRAVAYRHVIDQLEDNIVYTPAMIAEVGVAGIDNPKKKSKLYQRIRITLGSYARKNFPRQGDGIVERPGQAATFGYFGRRWKATYGAP
jgi:hypothetical protein